MTKATKVTLSRKQIHQLGEILLKFPDIEYFDIDEITSSGIGRAHYVKLDYIAYRDTMIDITDVARW